MTNDDPLNHSPKNVLLMSSPAYESAVLSSPIGRYAAPRPMGHMAEVKLPVISSLIFSCTLNTFVVIDGGNKSHGDGRYLLECSANSIT